jgi:hypothetical protein
MMEGVGSGLAVVVVGWWCPFGAASDDQLRIRNRPSSGRLLIFLQTSKLVA